MKNIFFAAIFSLASFSLLAEGTNDLSDEKSRASYAFGILLGSEWKAEKVDLDADTIARGIKDATSGGPALLTTQEAAAVFNQFKKDFQAKIAAENEAEGNTFLATNKNNPGVTTLPDGLQYKIIAEGAGTTPMLSDTVTVNYSGKLLDGTEFDSSYKRGQPATFPVTGVIKGWTEALTQMKVGSKWQVFIPSDLAYGPSGTPGIPPNSTLIFEIELLDTKNPAPPAPMTSDIIKVPSADEMKNGAKIETINPEDFQKLQSQSKTN